jgi:hypothetical protein
MTELTGMDTRKIAKPDLYHGDRTKLEEWLLQWDLYFKLADDKVDDHDKVSLMTTFLRGEASRWINPYLKKYLDEANEEEDIEQLFENINNFKDHIRKVFGTANEESKAIRAIQQLKQKTSAAEYAAEFQHHAVQTGWDDKALKAMYRQGLKNDVRIELMRSGAGTDTLDELYQETIRIDAELFELRLELRQNSGGKASYGAPRSGKNYYPPPARHRTGSTNNYGPQPMEGVQYNNLEGRDKNHSRRGRGRGGHQGVSRGDAQKKKVTCYGCGKEGHFARDCRSKNKVTRQFNTHVRTPPGDDADDEWEILDSPMGRLAVDSPDDESSQDDDVSIDLPLEEGPILSKEQAERMERAIHRGNWLTDKQRQRWIIQIQARTEKEEEPLAVEPDEEASDEEDEDYQECALDEMGVMQYLSPDSDKENEPPTKNDKRAELTEKLRAKQVNWWNQTQEELERKKQERATQYDAQHPYSTRREYKMDHRNLLHGRMHWTACVHRDCTIHDSSKRGGFYPDRKGRTCKWFWFECPTDDCDQHLWDKRQAKYFVNHEDPARILHMSMLVNGNCHETQWQTCLHPDCKKHRQAKEFHGFEKEQSFLGQRLAPGIDPNTAPPEGSRR